MPSSQTEISSDVMGAIAPVEKKSDKSDSRHPCPAVSYEEE
jgi:hypothetical protein